MLIFIHFLFFSFIFIYIHIHTDVSWSDVMRTRAFTTNHNGKFWCCIAFIRIARYVQCSVDIGADKSEHTNNPPSSSTHTHYILYAHTRCETATRKRLSYVMVIVFGRLTPVYQLIFIQCVIE